ncbi:hypothetical protein KLP28_11645 [Nocardioidaceae bacterium]|nr:hypothetical protein KLP28_11645 [Nocardioidaceae bacterium]
MSKTTEPAAGQSVKDAQEEEFGGVKPFVALLGWLTATGMAVLLTALLAAVGAGVALVTGSDTAQEAQQLAQSNQVSAEQVGWAGAIALGVIVFLAYYTGGYVAGRMARFDGVRQGFAVWVWAVVIAVVVAVLGAVAGDAYDVLGQLNSFPRLPASPGDLGLAGIIALLLVAATSLVGALAGGLAGMAFHRRVDKVGRRA